MPAAADAERLGEEEHEGIPCGTGFAVTNRMALALLGLLACLPLFTVCVCVWFSKRKRGCFVVVAAACMRAVVVCAWCHSFVAQLWAVFAVIGLEFMNKLCDGCLLCAGGWGLGEIEQELQARAAGKSCRQEMQARDVGKKCRQSTAARLLALAITTKENHSLA